MSFRTQIYQWASELNSECKWASELNYTGELPNSLESCGFSFAVATSCPTVGCDSLFSLLIYWLFCLTSFRTRRASELDFSVAISLPQKDTEEILTGDTAALLSRLTSFWTRRASELDFKCLTSFRTRLLYNNAFQFAYESPWLSRPADSALILLLLT